MPLCMKNPHVPKLISFMRLLGFLQCKSLFRVPKYCHISFSLIQGHQIFSSLIQGSLNPYQHFLSLPCKTTFIFFLKKLKQMASCPKIQGPPMQIPVPVPRDLRWRGSQKGFENSLLPYFSLISRDKYSYYLHSFRYQLLQKVSKWVGR